MHIFEHISIFSQAILRVLSPAADTCQFHTLWPQLPEPLLSLEGRCILDSDCTGYQTIGFCRGATNILVSQGYNQGDLVGLPLGNIASMVVEELCTLC